MYKRQLYCCNNGGFNYVESNGYLAPHGIADDYSGGRIERIDIETGMEYSRNVIAVATETKDKIAKEVETRVAAVNTNVCLLYTSRCV